ncbi:MAG: tetratricopeptide repeat protein [Promethearchaeota archaeon]
MIDFKDLEKRLRKSNLKLILLEIDNKLLNFQGNSWTYLKLIYFKAKTLSFLELYDESLVILRNLQKRCLKFSGSGLCIENSLLLAKIYSKKGDLKQCLDVLQEIEKKLHDIKNINHHEVNLKKIQMYNIRSYSLWRLGHLEDAISAVKQALEFRENNDIGDTKEIGKSYSLLGTFLCESGDLINGQKILNQSLKILKKNGDLITYSTVLNNIGWTYKIQGKFDLALKFLKESVDLQKKLSTKQTIRVQLANIGVISWQKGNLHDAMRYLKESLKYEEKIGNKLEIVDCIFYLFTISIDQGKKIQAGKYLDNIKKLYESEEENKMLEAIYYTAYAIMLKSNPRAKNIYDAQEILKRVINSDVAKFEITLIAMINLCDLYLYELKNSNDEEILKEINSILDKLLLSVKKHNSYHLWAEIYLIQAKFALVQLDLKSARSLLTKAQKLADSKGLTRLAMNISATHDEFLEQYNIWKGIKQTKKPISERIKLAKINNQMERLLRQGESGDIDLRKELPMGFNILNENGTVFFSKSFAPEWIADENLIGAFISAFHSFSGEIFSENFDRAKFGEYYILVRTESPILFCYIYKGHSYHAIQKLDELIKKLKEKTPVWEKLLHFIKYNEVFSNLSFPVFNQILTEVFSA